MRVGWTDRLLSDVCVGTETVNPRNSPADEFTYVDVSSVSNETFRIVGGTQLVGRDAPSRARKLIRAGDVIFATVRPTLQRIALVPEQFDGQICSTGYVVLRPGPALDSRFLFYALFRPEFLQAMEDLQSGASYPAVTDKQVLQQSIPVPPLDEQKRIVAKLDKIYAALDGARTDAEANLADADELFERELISSFEHAANSFKRLTFDQLCATLTPKTKIKRSDYLSKGEYPIVSQEADLVAGYWNDRGALLGLESPVVVFGDHTRCLKYVDFDFVVGADGTKVLQPCDGINPMYLYYGLRSIPIAEVGYARHFRFLKAATLPALKEAAQENLAVKLRNIETKVQRLVVGYERKLEDLEELRQASLQKAFAGGIL